MISSSISCVSAFETGSTNRKSSASAFNSCFNSLSVQKSDSSQRELLIVLYVKVGSGFAGISIFLRLSINIETKYTANNATATKTEISVRILQMLTDYNH